MATLIDTTTGAPIDVPDETAGQWLAQPGGRYTLKPGTTINVSGPGGAAAAVDASGLTRDPRLAAQTAAAENQAATQRQFDVEHDTFGSQAKAFAGGALHWANEALPATFARDWLTDKLGIDNPFAEDMKAHWIASHAVEAADAVGGFFVGGGEVKAAKAAVEGAEASRGAKVLTAAEKLAAADDPALIEHAASALGSKAMYGGEAASAVETTLKRANGAVGTAADLSARSGALPEDLTGLGVKELQAAEKSELVSLKAAREAQIGDLRAAHEADIGGMRSAHEADVAALSNAHEAAKAPLASDIVTFRREVKAQKVFLATQGAEDSAIRELGARAKKADFALDRLLNDPKGLAEDPRSALKALRVQEAAYDELLQHGDALRATFATDSSGVRKLALDAIPNVLERNRGLQTRLADVASSKLTEKIGASKAALTEATAAKRAGMTEKLAELRGAELTSPRLQQIRDAKELAAVGANEKPSFLQKMTEGGVYGKAHLMMGALGAAVGGPLGAAIGMAAPAVAAKVGKYVSEKLFGRLASEGVSRAGRAASALTSFVSAAPKFAPAAKVLATEVLNHVRYAPGATSEGATRLPLAEAYKARTAEIRSQVVPNLQTGQLELKPDARQAIANRIMALAGGSPLLGDKIETVLARRIEYLANEMPRKPEIGGMQIGPDKWQPSDMQMREWARKAHAVEDPQGVIERLAAGTITTEDRDAMKAVYPEMFNSIVTQVIERLPTLRTQMPFQKRLALSVFTGVPVDAALDPRILNSLQANYAAESGTADGTAPPKPQPQFGSVRSADKATPAQRRAAGETAV